MKSVVYAEATAGISYSVLSQQETIIYLLYEAFFFLKNNKLKKSIQAKTWHTAGKLRGRIHVKNKKIPLYCLNDYEANRIRY